MLFPCNKGSPERALCIQVGEWVLPGHPACQNVCPNIYSLVHVLLRQEKEGQLPESERKWTPCATNTTKQNPEMAYYKWCILFF